MTVEQFTEEVAKLIRGGGTYSVHSEDAGKLLNRIRKESHDAGWVRHRIASGEVDV